MTSDVARARVPAFRQIVTSQAKLMHVTSGFEGLDGPVFGRLGIMYFSDAPSRRILQYTIPRWHIPADSGEVSLYRQERDRTSGLTLDHQGRLLACRTGAGQVVRSEVSGEISVLADSSATRGVQAPRDVVFAVDGSIYFTDRAESSPDVSPSDGPPGAVFQITRSGDVRPATLECRRPAGLALDARQLNLYVADQYENNIRVFPIQADGALASGSVFVQLSAGQASPPAGLKTDRTGNVYLCAAEGVRIFNPQGIELGVIHVPDKATNCCWGRAWKGLYITAGGSIYYMPTEPLGTVTF